MVVEKLIWMTLVGVKGECKCIYRSEKVDVDDLIRMGMMT